MGFTSECELIDAWLECDLPLEQIYQTIEGVLPPGLEIHGIETIDIQAPALQTQITSAVYVVTLLDDLPDLDERVKRITSAEHSPRQRRNKSYDLRPLLEIMAVISPIEVGNRRLRVQLSARESATGRPEELLDEMGIKFENTRVHREKLLFQT